MHYAFQTESKLYIVMDYVSGGELFTHLYKAEHFNEETVRIYIAEVVLALEHLHKLGIIYRDIKLENILLDGQGHIVIADFGLSKIFREGAPDRATSFCGTLEYMAPEIIRAGPQGHDLAVDWWSVGVLTYELLTGASPFTVVEQNNSQSDITRRIQKAEPTLPASMSETVKDFILKMLHKDPQRRLGGNSRDAHEIKSHPFFKGIDWEELRLKHTSAPFCPELETEDDTRNFSEEFTKLPPIDSPASIPLNSDRLFRGYSYIAPWHLNEILKAKAIRNYHKEFKNDPIKDLPLFEPTLTIDNKIPADGAFSLLFYAKDERYNQQLLMKVIDQKNYRFAESDALITFSKYPHANIVDYKGTYSDSGELLILMEFLHGKELWQLISEHNGLEERHCCEIFVQLCDALQHIHSHQFIHGDIKPENIVFVDNTTTHVKIVDFGFASYCTEQKYWTDQPRYTLDYAPPEAIKSTFYATYSNAFDVWCLGATLYSMRMGHPPFRTGRSETNLGYSELKERIINGNFFTATPRWESSSPAFKKLVSACLEKDYKKRISLDELKNHSWVQAFSVAAIKTETDDTSENSANSEDFTVNLLSLQESESVSSPKSFTLVTAAKARTISEISRSNDSKVASTEVKCTRQHNAVQSSKLSDDSSSMAAVAGSSTDTKTISTLSQHFETTETSSTLATAGSSPSLRTMSDLSEKAEEPTNASGKTITSEICKNTVSHIRKKITAELADVSISTASEKDTSNNGNFESSKEKHHVAQIFDTSSVLGIAGCLNDVTSEWDLTEDCGSKTTDFNINLLLLRRTMSTSQLFISINTDLLGFDENNLKPVFKFEINSHESNNIKCSTVILNNESTANAMINENSHRSSHLLTTPEHEMSPLNVTTTFANFKCRKERKNKKSTNINTQNGYASVSKISKKSVNIDFNIRTNDDGYHQDTDVLRGFLVKEALQNQGRTTQILKSLERCQRIMNLTQFAHLHQPLATTSAAIALVSRDDIDRELNDIFIQNKWRRKRYSVLTQSDFTDVRNHLKRVCTLQPPCYKEILVIEPGTKKNTNKYKLVSQKSEKNSRKSINGNQKTRKRYDTVQLSSCLESSKAKKPRLSIDNGLMQEDSSLKFNEINSATPKFKTEYNEPVIFAVPNLRRAVRTSFAICSNSTTTIKNSSDRQSTNQHSNSHHYINSLRSNAAYLSNEIQAIVEATDIQAPMTL